MCVNINISINIRMYIKMKSKNSSKEKPFWMITNHGYNLDEVVSTLQKSIRRGMEEESLFWAIELAGSGYGQYLWRRLGVTVSEDIGLIEPVACMIVNSLAENCKRCTKSWKDPEMLPIAHAVLYLCRCYKNREVDDYIEYMMLKIKEGYCLNIPGWALDVHTDEGKKLIKENGVDPVEKFYHEGAILDREKDLDQGNIYKKKLYKKLNLNTFKKPVKGSKDT